MGHGVGMIGRCTRPRFPKISFLSVFWLPRPTVNSRLRSCVASLLRCCLAFFIATLIFYPFHRNFGANMSPTLFDTSLLALKPFAALLSCPFANLLFYRLLSLPSMPFCSICNVCPLVFLTLLLAATPVSVFLLFRCIAFFPFVRLTSETQRRIHI